MPNYLVRVVQSLTKLTAPDKTTVVKVPATPAPTLRVRAPVATVKVMRETAQLLLPRLTTVVRVPLGPRGPAGASGNHVFSGAGVPDPLLGVSDDFYIDADTGDFYQNDGSSGWQFLFTASGGSGATISFGAGVPVALGNDGDVYVDVTTGGFYQFTTSAGWELQVILGSGGGSGSGGGGFGLPLGGIAGDILVKQSGIDGDAIWVAPTFAQDANVVHKTGDENISGIKTFLGSLLASTFGIAAYAGFYLYLAAAGSNLTADRTLSIDVHDADRLLDLQGNLSVTADASVSGTNTGDQDLSGYALLTYVDAQLALKADQSYVDTQLALKADQSYVDTQLALKADDADVVHKTGDETINGVKTFNSVPLVTADPTTGNELARKSYVDAAILAGIAANDAMIFKGVIDCSANPNYPAADRGWSYKVSVAGKIGGASGPNVEAGDLLICITDGTAAGNHATVGANWCIVQANLDGAVTGPTSAVVGRVATFANINGKIIQDGGVLLSDLALDANVVKLTGNQTIAGIKTFSSVPVGPNSDPVNANDLVRKSYADGLVSQAGAWTYNNSFTTGIAVGEFRLNNAVVASATVFRLAYIDANGVNWNSPLGGNIFAQIKIGSSFVLRRIGGTGENIVVLITGTGVDIGPSIGMEWSCVVYATSGAIGTNYYAQIMPVDLSSYALDANVVKLTGNQTVAGIKTFSSIPVGPASDPTSGDQLTRKTYVDNLDAANVKLTGNQTVAGTKTFSSVPVTTGGDPVNANDLCRKSYVDAQIAAVSGFTAATQAQMEAAASNTVGVTPLNFHWHDAAIKAWGKANGAGTSLQVNFNITSITDNGAGDISFTFNTNFSSVNFSVVAAVQSTTSAHNVMLQSTGAGSSRLRAFDPGVPGLADPTSYFIMSAGDQ